MQDQHKHIKGYRDLSPYEIALMNRIKQHEALTLQLVEETNKHLCIQLNNARTNSQEMMRLGDANPSLWLSVARTDFQTGFMALVRAVAQPAPIEVQPNPLEKEVQVLRDALSKACADDDAVVQSYIDSARGEGNG